MDAPDKSREPVLPRPLLALVVVLLALPVVALMWVSSYAKDDPHLFGFPFFFWYQFAWVFLAAGCTSIAYKIVATHERSRRAYRDEVRDSGRTDGTGGTGGDDLGGRR